MKSFNSILIIMIALLIAISSFTGCAGNKAQLAEEERREEQRIAQEKQAQEKAEADRLAKEQEKIEEQKRIEAARLEEERMAAEKKENAAKASLKTVNFDYDKATLNPAQRSILQTNAEVLMAYKKWNIIIEGHCDQRGSTEYNLALGEKRAATVREYYLDYGISNDRMKLVSFGEEKPVDNGNNEKAYAKNRRAETVVR